MTGVEQLAERAQLGAVVGEWLEAVGAPGAVVAMSVDGEVWNAAFGHADLQRQQPLAVDARFSLYSITKAVVATLVLRLVEGKAPIAMNDTLQMYFPDLPIETPLPIRHVLNHTSGLPSYGRSPDYLEAVRANPETPWSDDEFLQRTMSSGLLFLPGHGWRYSNIGYLLLRRLLEQEAGASFSTIVHAYLGHPFGLESFSGASTLKQVQQLTPGYSTMLTGDGSPENVIPRFHPGWVGHRVVVANAADVARFFDLLFEPGKLVEPWLLDAMLTGALVGQSHRWMVNQAYGMGLMMDLSHPFGVVAGHVGTGPGYSTAAYHFGDVHGHRVTAVALVNRDGSDVATDIVFTMVERLARELA